VAATRLTITGESRIGDRLPTANNRATAYSFNRTVIREAMKVIQEKGLLETYLGRGTIAIGNIAIGGNTPLILNYG